MNLMLFDSSPWPHGQLHAEGWDIYTEHGKRYWSNGVNDFLLFQRVLEKPDKASRSAWLASHLDDYRGFTEHRVTSLMSVVPGQVGLKALRPENYPDYWDAFEWLTDEMLAHGRLIEWTLSCDRVPMTMSDAYLKAHVGQAFEILRVRPNLVEGVNEINHSLNRVDPSKVFTDVPREIFFCCGSSLSGGECPRFARDDYSDFHLTRKEKGIYIDAQPIEQIIGWAGFAGLQHPIRINETPGAQKSPDPWRRLSDPQQFRRIASISRAFSGGSMLIQNAIFSLPFDAVERKCADAWQDGMRFDLR